MHATCVPFHQLLSVGLPGFFRKFSCTGRAYHFTNYHVWGFPVFSGNFRARDVRTISPTTKCGASRFFQEIFVHTTYVSFTNYHVWGFPVFSGNFCARDVCTMLNRQYWGLLRLAPIISRQHEQIEKCCNLHCLFLRGKVDDMKCCNLHRFTMA